MRSLLICCLALSGLSLGGCRGGLSEDPPIVPIRNMYNQPRYDPQSASDFFQDGRTMRPPVAGAVAQEMPADITVQTGRTADDSAWLLETPGMVVRDFHPAIEDEDHRRHMATPRQSPRGWGEFSAAEKQEARRAMLERGQQRFNIYCAPCHAISGDGEGLISQRAAWLAETLRDPGAAGLNAPTLHDDRIRTMPDGQLYAVISNGIRNMPAYSQSIPLADRWAIVQYVRALQINQASAQHASNTPSNAQEALR